MAHFAKISENNEVLQILYVNDKDTVDENNNEVESIGQKYLEKHNHWPAHLWIKCSYRTKAGVHYEDDNTTISNTQEKAFRKNYPGIGWIWDSQNNLFKPPKKYFSWTLNLNTGLWDPPVPKPEQTGPNFSEDYQWDENNQTWVLSSRNN